MKGVLRAAVEGISWIEQGIADYRSPGSMLGLPFFLALKAEALFAANRPSEAREAEAVTQKCGARFCSAELHRLRGLFLTAIAGNEAQIEASLYEAIRIAREQKSISLD